MLKSTISNDISNGLYITRRSQTNILKSFKKIISFENFPFFPGILMTNLKQIVLFILYFRLILIKQLHENNFQGFWILQPECSISIITISERLRTPLPERHPENPVKYYTILKIPEKYIRTFIKR
jgi:hypothetical protein